MQLDQTCRLPLGTRDAVHVPVVVAKLKETTLSEFRDMQDKLHPGAYVKFIDDKFTLFVPCPRSEAHGIINPFIDEICIYDEVIVLLIPGITTLVRHHFDINPQLREVRQKVLEYELEEAQKNDPGCSDCYAIKNNEVIRY